METTREVKMPADLRKRLEEATAAPPKNREWEEWEKVVVRDYYPKFGAEGLKPYLPGRTRDAITAMAVRLKVKWTGVKK